MTTPNGNAPDGAYVIGSRYGQDRDESNIRSTIKAPPINAWQHAQDVIKEWCMVEKATMADHKDGQNAIRDRMDLLNQNDGYGCAFMGYNWNIGHSQWIVIPFDEQLGPMKKAQVSKPVPESGFLTLKAGGLWRIDTHIAITGYSVWYLYVDPGWLPYYEPIYPTLMLEVVAADGSLISATEYNMVSDLTQSQAIYATDVNAPRSAAFTKTLVLDDMPDEAAAGASDHWVNVRLSIKFLPGPNFGGPFSAAYCKILGGTKLSSLIATRWSKDVVNAIVAPVVPDGGNLG